MEIWKTFLVLCIICILLPFQPTIFGTVTKESVPDIDSRRVSLSSLLKSSTFPQQQDFSNYKTSFLTSSSYYKVWLDFLLNLGPSVSSCCVVCLSVCLQVQSYARVIAVLCFASWLLEPQTSTNTGDLQPQGGRIHLINIINSKSATQLDPDRIA